MGPEEEAYVKSRMIEGYEQGGTRLAGGITRVACEFGDLVLGKGSLRGRAHDGEAPNRQ